MNKSLHIAVIQQSPDIGGAETFMCSLVTEFLKQGHTVCLATDSEKYAKLYKNLKVTINKIPFILDISGNWKGLVKSILRLPIAIAYYSSLLRSYKNNNVHLILMSGFSEKLLVSFLTLFIKIPVVWIEYGPLAPIIKRNFSLPFVLYTLISKIPKRIIVPTENTKKSLLNDIYIAPSKIIVIPCGIVLHKKKHNRKKPKYLKNKIVIGNVSRLTREKGQQLLINAMPDILSKNPQVHLLLVGDGPDKEYFSELIKKLNISKSVTLTGFVKNTDDYYRQMDIFVFPTIWPLEGFGLVMVEAMDYGLPIIAHNSGPVPEIVKNNNTGLLVPLDDKNALIYAILSLVTNQALRERLGGAGRRRAVNLFDIEKISKKYEKVFYEAIS
ncbi:MAG: hypothetical protein KatS3mg089_0674 [Patescibacteria group bacterium]|nr:MAG: hypothetical protein KatS3mg089_0674 [Patescibacteria group bacterium]